MNKSRKNNKPVIALVALIIVILLITMIAVISSILNSPPKVVLAGNNNLTFNKEDKPESVSILYEWSTGLKGFVTEGIESRISTVSEHLKSISNEIGCELSVEKYADDRVSDSLTPLSQLEVTHTPEKSLLLSMLSAQTESDIKIVITDLTERDVSIGEINSAITNNVFFDSSQNNALAIISIMSDFEGYLDNGASEFSTKRRPFFIFISGQNTKVSYFVDQLRSSSRIKRLIEDKEFYCEVLSNGCGIFGIDYDKIVIDKGDEENESKAREFEEKSKRRSSEVLTVNDINRINANVNFEDKPNIVRISNSRDDEEGQNGKQKLLAYKAKSSNEVPGKLRLKIPYIMLNGVNINSMVPTIEYRIYSENSKKGFTEYTETIDPQSLRMELAYNKMSMFLYTLELLREEVTYGDIKVALRKKSETLKEQKFLTPEIKEDIDIILDMIDNASDFETLIEQIGEEAFKDFDEKRAFPIGVKADDADNSIGVNTIFAKLNDMSLQRRKNSVIKIDYKTVFSYNKDSLPMWVTSQNSSSRSDVVNGKIYGLCDMFEGLYSFLEKNSKVENEFTIYIKNK